LYLNSLFLNNNVLAGEIPKEVGHLDLCEYLDLSDNWFSGRLASEMNGLSNLVSLKINRSRGGLGGSLPSFSGLTKIEQLDLSFNRFNGAIPRDFLKGRSKDGEVKVRLSSNDLEEIPAELSKFNSMILEIEDNKITTLPDELCQQPGWMNGESATVAPRACDAILCPKGFWSPIGRASTQSGVECQPCESNLFFGETVCEAGGVASNSEVEILDKLFNMTGGWYWSRTHTNWTKPGVPICYREGVICGYMPADMNSDVTELRLHGFDLKGRIPSEIFQLTGLRRLELSGNQVEVSFNGIEQATSLQILSLANTNVPSLKWIEKAPASLADIDLAGTQLNGTFPTELLQLSSLLSIRLDQNELTGPIPSEISGFSNLRLLSLSSNAFSGTLPSNLADLKILKELDVSNNLLSGLLPTEIQGLLQLARLDLSSQRSRDSFTGPLLPFSTSPSLNHLNMSQNAFTGSVPSSMLSGVGKSGQISVDVSGNKLVGGLPGEFNAFQQLNINLVGNKIVELPSEVCNNVEWMGGITGVVLEENRCDSILCKPGTSTLSGRQMHRGSIEMCKPCPRENEAPYFGSISCVDPEVEHERQGKSRRENSLLKEKRGRHWLYST